MHDSADFTLRITVTAPEQAVDDYDPTQRFARPEGLPGVTGRAATRPQPPQQAPRPMTARLRSVPPAMMLVTENELPKVMAPSIPSPTAESAALRIQARATPLSDDEERRVQRRIRAHQKIAWARDLLRKFNFDA